MATQQRALKWLLAYSTLSLMGFIFVLIGLGHLFAALWFLFQHAILKEGLFFVAGVVEADEVARRSRILLVLAGVLAFSLVGAPPLAGFWMALLHTGWTTGDWPILAGIVLASALSIVYSLRVFVRLCWGESPASIVEEIRQSGGGRRGALAAALLAALILWLGIWPTWRELPRRGAYLIWLFVVLLPYHVVKANVEIAWRLLHPTPRVNPDIVAIPAGDLTESAMGVEEQIITLAPAASCWRCS